MEYKAKKKLGCWWFLLPPAILFVLFIIQMWGPSPKLRPGKTTTYIDSHIGPDGLPDYVAYVHDRSAADIKPEENAAVLYWKALWPGEIAGNVAHQNILCDALGMPIPNAKEALVSPFGAPQGDVATWIEANVLPPIDSGEQADSVIAAVDSESGSDDELSDDEFEEVELSPEEQRRFDLAGEMAGASVSRSLQTPWTREQMPPLGKWVDQNKKPLDWLVEGSARPRYYNPSPNMIDGSDDSMVEMLLPGVQMLRKGARGLMCRAMFHIGEGKPEEAWRDIRACHQLGRHASQGWTLVEQLVGIAIDAMATKGTQALLHHSDLTAEQAERIRKELEAMRPTQSMNFAMSEGERLMYLDIVKRMSTGKMNINNYINLVGQGGSNAPIGIVSSTKIDWNLVMERGNEWYDRLADMADLPREERIPALEKFEADVEAIAPQNNPSLVAGSLISPRARSELMSDAMLGLFLPALSACSESSDRQMALHEMNCLAAALAEHRAKRGSYPAKLEELVPSILKQLPTDVFSGNSFIYKKTDDGFLLYSVFRNGIDDGGRDMEGCSDKGKWLGKKLPHDQNNSDLVFLMPLPKFDYSVDDD